MNEPAPMQICANDVMGRMLCTCRPTHLLEICVAKQSLTFAVEQWVPPTSESVQALHVLPLKALLGAKLHQAVGLTKLVHSAA